LPFHRTSVHGDPEEQNIVELPAAWLEEVKRKIRAPNGKAPPLPEKIDAGNRNTHLTSAAGSMRRRGMSDCLPI
jgi:hypothetical protein